jgi:hypothetical protein
MPGTIEKKAPVAAGEILVLGLGALRQHGAVSFPPSDIAKALKIGRASVYRFLGQRPDREAGP